MAKIGDRVSVQDNRSESGEHIVVSRERLAVIVEQCSYPSDGSRSMVDSFRVRYIDKSGVFSGGHGYYPVDAVKLSKANFMVITEPDYEKLLPGNGPRKVVKQEEPVKPLTDLSKSPTGDAPSKSRSKRVTKVNQTTMFE